MAARARSKIEAEWNHGTQFRGDSAISRIEFVRCLYRSSLEVWNRRATGGYGSRSGPEQDLSFMLKSSQLSLT
jgi:hypothetical protein